MGATMGRKAIPLLTALVVFLALAATVRHAEAQFDMSGMGMDAPKAVAVRADIKYIRCSVCDHLVKQGVRMTKALFKDVEKKKVTEFDIIELLEKFTDPIKAEGEWLLKLDMVEEGDAIVLKETDEVGECNSECATIAKAAEELLGDHDTDMAEKLFKGVGRSKLMHWLCYQETNACSKKPPPVSKHRKPGPKHQPVDPQKLQMQRMMASMKEQGMGGQVYDREALQAQVASYEDYLGGMDEDETEGPVPASKQAGDNAEESSPLIMDTLVDGAKKAYSTAKEGVASALSMGAQGVKNLFGAKEEDL